MTGVAPGKALRGDALRRHHTTGPAALSPLKAGVARACDWPRPGEFNANGSRRGSAPTVAGWRGAGLASSGVASPAGPPKKGVIALPRRTTPSVFPTFARPRSGSRAANPASEERQYSSDERAGTPQWSGEPAPRAILQSRQIVNPHGSIILSLSRRSEAPSRPSTDPTSAVLTLGATGLRRSCDAVAYDRRQAIGLAEARACGSLSTVPGALGALSAPGCIWRGSRSRSSLAAGIAKPSSGMACGSSRQAWTSG